MGDWKGAMEKEVELSHGGIVLIVIGKEGGRDGGRKGNWTPVLGVVRVRDHPILA